jgi:alpha-L-fucosidase 2
MKRRDFIKTGAVAAGLASSLKLLPSLAAAESDSPKPSARPGALPDDNRSADYLRRAQEGKFLPKPPVVVESSQSDAVKISPMPLAERVRRKIVPRRGYCSLAPGSGALLSGTGAVSIELAGDPYTEQIPFRHEMLYVPRRRPAEAPKIADILPQVRQMMLDGKLHDAAQFAYQKWRENPVQGGGMGGGGGGGFSMRLELPKSASVKDYLRTVDFESTEVKVHWTDERGQWVRQTFTSRPDNLVVQQLTAPKGQSVNVRITVAAGGGSGRGGRGGRASSG